MVVSPRVERERLEMMPRGAGGTECNLVVRVMAVQNDLGRRRAASKACTVDDTA